MECGHRSCSCVLRGDVAGDEAGPTPTNGSSAEACGDLGQGQGFIPQVSPPMTCANDFLIESIASQSLTCIPARTRPPRSHKAVNAPSSGMPPAAPPGRSRRARRCRGTPCRGRTGRRRSRAAGRRAPRRRACSRAATTPCSIGVVPVLDAQMTTEQRVVGVRHVSGCVDVRLGGAQLCVDDDAVVDGRPAASASSTSGQHADPDHEQVGLERRPVCQTTTAAPCVALDVTGDLRRRYRRSTPCSRCEVAKTLATSGPRTRTSGRSRDSRTVTSAPLARAAAATSRPIQPPPTMHDSAAAASSSLDAGGVLEGAQVGDRRAALVGRRQATWPGTGGQQQLVVALRTAVGCHVSGRPGR